MGQKIDKKNNSCAYCSFSIFCHGSNSPSECVSAEHALVKSLCLKKREMLYPERCRFRSLYVIQSGHIKTYEIDKHGHEFIHGFYYAGEVIGFEAIYTQYYRFSAVALTDTTVCEVSYDHFLEVIQADPVLQKQTLYLISQQLNSGSYLSLISAEQRLAAFLIDLCHRLSPFVMQTSFVLPMSRQDIGNYLRLTAETISRILSQFKHHQLIAIENKKIQILQLQALKSIATIG